MSDIILYDNKYEYIKDLGEGGFGKVVLAKEKISERFVAIKCLKESNPEKQSNIIQENQVISKLNNPNIVTYFHNFIQDNCLHIVMEFCPNGNLRDKLRQKSIIELTKGLKWIREIAFVMQIIHNNKIIHHDIKPDNILFSELDIIKVSDFGVANTLIGTRMYKAPEMFGFNEISINDSRIDVYALGVTLLEILTGQNPFYDKSFSEIFKIHESRNFNIDKLPQWVQDIILKAINIIPELRFQNMLEFSEAIESKNVPIIINKDIITAGDLAHKADNLLNKKKWNQARAFLETARIICPDNNKVLQVYGKYNLLIRKEFIAKKCFERAKSLNPRLNIQKELGWLYLEEHNYPSAISLLSEYLYSNPNDLEAHNLLVKCYYYTNRYEIAFDYLELLLNNNPKIQCFRNNFIITQMLLKKDVHVLYEKYKDNPFIAYNHSLITEKDTTWSDSGKSILKSKLLFQEFRFNDIDKTNNTIVFQFKDKSDRYFSDKIITVGRKGYDCNLIKDFEGTEISRRHFLVINNKNDVWLYDLNGYNGVYVDEKKVKDKMFLLGVHNIEISNNKFSIKTDKDILI